MKAGLLHSAAMTALSRLPSTDPLVALADRCVQCGLCLPACPTYGLGRLEPESPRGRIALARAFALGTVEPTPAGDAHLDHCLGCGNCEAVCPAGVQYGELLVQARQRQRQRRTPGWRQRLAEGLMARPRLLAVALWLYRPGYPVLPRALRLLPRPPGRAARSPRQSTETISLDTGPRRSRSVALFTGCIARAYEAPLRDAFIRLGAAIGVGVNTPVGQGCCGTAHAHGGDTATRDRMAGTNRRAFADADTVLTLASGCHEAVAQALAGSNRTLDAIEWLSTHVDALHFRESGERVALHLPCTQRNMVKSVAAVRALLARVPGLVVVELTAGHGCCGAAGTQMLTNPTRAAEFRAPLLAQLERSGATRLLSANIGCRLHFANATALPVQHPLEFLAGQLA
ncbi:(Fe-S)-binding protein [Lysobacter fragariae]